jgi:HAD superfamily hydrolase (TIGR01509 family)
MIRNILFDIGVVLLHIDYGPALARVLPLCDPARMKSIDRFFSLVERDPMMADYERGKVSAESFFGRFVELTGYRGTYEEFAEAWFNILAENRPMIEFARELSRTHRIYLATNAGVIHVPRMYRTFASLGFVTGRAASCELGEVKPDRGFYEKALAQFGASAETCLLVDDRPENVEGARACGIRSILYTNPEETIDAVRAELARDK